MEFTSGSQNITRRKSTISLMSSKGAAASALSPLPTSDIIEPVDKEKKDMDASDKNTAASAPVPMDRRRGGRRNCWQKFRKYAAVAVCGKGLKLCTCACVIATFIMLITLLSFLMGAFKQCSGRVGNSSEPDVHRRSGKLYEQLSMYNFNFSTAHKYSLVGKRQVMYCHDIDQNGTLCDSDSKLARTMFISSSNHNISTNRLSSEVYSSLTDFLNWSSGKFPRNEGWDRLHEVVELLDDFFPDSSGVRSELLGADSLSSSDSIICSQKLVYSSMSSLIHRIVETSSNILSPKDIAALAGMLDADDTEDSHDLQTVVKAKTMLSSGIETDLSMLMKMLAECSSTVWKKKNTAVPCRQTVVICSKHPRPVKFSDSSDLPMMEGPRKRQGSRRHKAQEKDGKDQHDYHGMYDVLDTLVLNLESNATCSQ